MAEEIDQSEAIGWTEALGSDADNPPAPRASGECVYLIRCPKCDEYEDPQAKDESGKFPPQQCKVCGTARKIEKFTVSDLEQGIKAQFEQWVREGAQQAITETMMSGDLEEADRLRDAYMASRREYTWDGKHVRAMRNCWTGVLYLGYLLLQRCHPKITEERASKIISANPKGWGMVFAWAQGNSRAPRNGDAGTNGKSPNQNGKSKSQMEPVTMDGR